MQNILLYVSTGIILFAYIGYLLLLWYGKSKEVSKSNGFDATKDILSEYDSINVIESSGYFTVYNLKRKVIKLATKCYYGKDLSSISLSLYEAGVSIVDSKKNKYIDIFRSILSNLKILYIFPIVALFISHSSFNQSDAKVSIIFLVVFLFFSYILIDIRNGACSFVNTHLGGIKDIQKNGCERVKWFMDKIVLFDKCIFFGELLMLTRLVFLLFSY